MGVIVLPWLILLLPRYRSNSVSKSVPDHEDGVRRDTLTKMSLHSIHKQSDISVRLVCPAVVDPTQAMAMTKGANAPPAVDSVKIQLSNIYIQEGVHLRPNMRRAGQLDYGTAER